MVSANAFAEAEAEDRGDIKHELIAMAQLYLAGFKDHKVVFEIPGLNYSARKTKDEKGNCVNVVKFMCKGFTEEHWQRCKADPVALQAEMDNRLEAQRLDDDQGCKVYHMRMHLSKLNCTRSIVTTFYEHEDANTGLKIVAHSS